jgi:hypothetical protein
MRSILVGAMSTCALWVAASAGSAQAPEAHDHGSGRLGKVSFPVSCAPEAGRRFERAKAVLHSFWWEEGDAAFNRVLEADPKCAMAYWGLAGRLQRLTETVEKQRGVINSHLLYQLSHSGLTAAKT